MLADHCTWTKAARTLLSSLGLSEYIKPDKKKDEQPNEESEAPKLLVIDDDPFFSRQWVLYLNGLYSVIYTETLSDAAQALCEHADISAIVLDVMMPPPQDVPLDVTADGLNTGLWFLTQIRDHIVKSGMPVALYTNRHLSVVYRHLNRLEIPEGLVRVCDKQEVPKERLAEVLKELRTHWPITSERDCLDPGSVQFSLGKEGR